MFGPDPVSVSGNLDVGEAELLQSDVLGLPILSNSLDGWLGKSRFIRRA